MSLQNFEISIRPKASPLKKELKALGITAGTAASFVGRSYPHILNQLNGVYPMQPHTEAKIQELIQMVRAEVS